MYATTRTEPRVAEGLPRVVEGLLKGPKIGPRAVLSDCVTISLLALNTLGLIVKLVSVAIPLLLLALAH